MRNCIKDDFLLTNQISKELYSTASSLPIVDFHCHLEAKDIYENKPFNSITEAWICKDGKGDHYKWRLLRAAGIEEKYITGDATDEEKFMKFASVMNDFIGSPIYVWCHMELKMFFGVTEALNSDSAKRIYDHCNEVLKTLKPQDMIKLANVKVICTTDDPTSDLKYHKLLRSVLGNTLVLPTFRPDNILNIQKDSFLSYIESLKEVTGRCIVNLQNLKDIIERRVSYFAGAGCRLTDHSLEQYKYAECSEAECQDIFIRRLKGEKVSTLETNMYKTYILKVLCETYKKYNLAMQLHIGAMRNNNTLLFNKLGVDCGNDAFDNSFKISSLAKLYDLLNLNGILPKTITYPLCDNDSKAICTLNYCFNDSIPGRMQLGAAWWFNDQITGIKKQLDDLSQLGLLSKFIGMLTDSRSFLSYARHDYFRRILCQYISSIVESGQFPDDREYLNKLVEDICYYNSIHYFNLGELLENEG